MSRSPYSSPRLRYLKARLSILARPSFLIALVFLSAVGLVIKEYWTNPDFLKFSQNQEISPPTPTSSSNQSLMSEEDRAIAADIGNLSILDYDQQQAQTSPSINNSKQVKKENETQLTKILDLVKKNESANEIKSNAKSQTKNTSSLSQQNPFLTQGENLLKFKIGSNEEVRNGNNLSPFSSGLQTPQTSFNSRFNPGIKNTNSTNQNQNVTPENVLKAAINKSNNQIQEKSTATTSTNQNLFGQSAQTPNNLNLPTSSANQRLLQNQTNSLVNTTLFNQPLNSQKQNLYSNFNNNQLPTTNYNQQTLNNQIQQNPYNNFNNNQIPRNNYNQPGLNNQVPSSNYNQSVLNNQVQNPYNNFNNNQVSTNNYNQPGLNNQVQNPYNNFNNNQVPTSNYNQQNPYNLNRNNQIMGSRYDISTQTKINNIYNKLKNRNNPTVVNPNTYTSPTNSGNTGYQQPNVQQFNSPYSTQTPVQYPNNRYRY